MTTQDFIAKTYNTRSTKDRSCSSVFTDRNGTVYSYGYHYPLAFHVKGLDFINESGYSNTTARHILWARQALNYDYIGVKLWRTDVNDLTYYTGSMSDKALEVIERALARELKSILEQIQAKKRKNTAVYARLQSEHERVYTALKTVMEAK